MTFKLQPLLPPEEIEIESKTVLKQAAVAHRRLAELKGVAKAIPNQGILINSLSLQEAKDSSAVENIITTHDELFKNEIFPKLYSNAAAKEVRNYVSALRVGYSGIVSKSLLTNNQIIEIHQELEGNNAGFRKLPGTDLRNQETGELVYTPPQDHDQVVALMDNLENFINNDDFCDFDDLVKMAIIHYQFESIHPFYDGNGRTGRIINVLYLVFKGLLDIPVLYLSRYITKTKAKYYRLLQEVRDKNNWEGWVLYILKAVEETAIETTRLVQGIHDALLDYKHRIRNQHKFYSQDLINSLFKQPYTKISFIMKDLKVSRITATNYLNQLTEAGFLSKTKLGRSNYYTNLALYNLLSGLEKGELGS